MTGEYKEKLPSGKGELIVTSHSWSIHYYFPGPDSRYNGTFVHIAGIHIDDYINAYKNNWNKYLEIKKATEALKGDVKIDGDMSMTIFVGGYHDGVCIRSYNMPLNTEENIMKVIEDFQWARKKGVSMMHLLNELA